MDKEIQLLIELINIPVSKWKEKQIDQWIEIMNLNHFKEDIKKQIQNGKQLEQENKNLLLNNLKFSNLQQRYKLSQWLNQGLDCFDYLLYKKQNNKIVSIFDTKLNQILSFQQQNIKIGRHSSNDIVIQNMNVSRFHCKLKQIGDSVYLKDRKSDKGVYLKSQTFHKLIQNQIILLGQTQIKINYSKITMDLELTIQEGPNKDEVFILNFNLAYAIFSIGKSRECSVIIDKDDEIGKVHARFLLIDQQFCIENLNVIKGIWIQV